MQRKFPTLLAFLTLLTSALHGIDVPAELKRAEEFSKRAQSLVLRNNLRPYWSSDGSHLAYQINTAPDEVQYFQVNLATGKKAPAFDHVLFSEALLKATNTPANPKKLPLDQLDIAADGTMRFRAFDKAWRFNPASQLIEPSELARKEGDLIAPEEIRRLRGHSGPPSEITIENGTQGEVELFWLGGSNNRKSYGKIAVGKSATQWSYSGHAWLIVDATGSPLAAVKTKDTPTFARITGKVATPPKAKPGISPDGKWRAFIREDNLFVEPTDGGEAKSLSTDGSPNHKFIGPLRWSPDSKMVVAFRVKPIKTRQVSIVQSSPADQLQPKLKTINYAKPGDPIEQPMPHLFAVDPQREVSIDPSLFSNPWNISEVAWANDSSEFSFVYNQRGHQVMRIVGVRADSGSTRTIFEDVSKTFIDYSQKTYIHRLPETREIIWASQRSGFNHLYLIDETTGRIKNSITQGDWNVREVIEVNTEKRQLLLKVMGVSGQDLYQMHFLRVSLDGGGFTGLTSSDGNHEVEFSPDGKFLTDTWSRVDQPPVVELRRAEDGKLVTELERADDAALIKTGWTRPERFVAKGRDGQTDIFGIIVRPPNFDPAKRYPVVEDIYAGPHDFFVPKNYSTWSGMDTMAGMGFVVVKMDGMGTNWRSKEFHDVAWKNLSDGGFPDRIAWIKAAAATRPWMDLSRVGIYGGSAGGHNALAGLLHHGDFYKVGVSDCGCHDNRMDKIWWNEAWMGWPVDESYERNSNVKHAAKLSGKLLLVVGELDTNVDPASTAQVVNALQEAGKNFDFLPIMNAGHGAAETPYGRRRRAEFLVQHLGGAID